MRHTEVTPEEEANNTELQTRLDKFWNMIEDFYEEEWRVEISGAIVLNVDKALLERILRDNPHTAKLHFGAHEEHNPEYRRYEWVDFPEDLIGLYAIEGIYNERQALVDGPRSYSFEQGY